MARKPPPDMGENLGGFGGLTFPDPESATEAPEAPEPAPKPVRVSERKRAVQAAETTTEAPERAKWGEGRTRNTRSFSLTEELFDKLRRYAAAKNVSLSEVAEIALGRAMDRAEEKNGGPFPKVPERKRATLDDL